MMRMFWNTSAAVGLTALLTAMACIGTGQGGTAHAKESPVAIVDPVADATHRHYTGLPEHFEAANVTHDGKLTPAQAKAAGWTRVLRHFDDIDTAHAGFVTEAQIHTYNVAHRHSRKSGSDA